MIRARFYIPGADSRPMKVPYPHPWWETGFNDTHCVVVAYADDEEQLLEFWPDAENTDIEERDDYVFTSRFPDNRSEEMK